MHNYSPYTTEKDFSEKLALLTNGKEARILAAFSGGCDSLALLALLCRTTGADNVTALYVNHRLRPAPELEKEIALNTSNCRKLGVRLIVEDLGEDTVKNLMKQRGNGMEEAARILRYRVLLRAAQTNHCPFIATAHHRDDQVETVHMRLMRGSPVTALRGINETVQYPQATVIRPLLDFPRSALEKYLEYLDLHWSTDSTNADLSIERNRVRNRELEAILKDNPAYADMMLDIQKKAVAECGSFTYPARDSIGIDFYKSLGSAQRLVALFAMWDAVLGTLLPATLIDRVNRAADSYCGRCIQEGANGAVFSFSGDCLRLTADSDNTLFSNFEAAVPLGGEVCGRTTEIELPGGLFLEKGRAADDRALRIRDCDFSGIPVVRFPREGEKMELKDGTKGLSRILQDMKIPPALRKRVPVIADEKGICAVFGRVYGAKDRLALRLRNTNGAAGTAYTCRKD